MPGPRTLPRPCCWDCAVHWSATTGSVPDMPSQLRVVWDPGFTAYNFGPAHPMSPVRLDLTARLCEAMGVFEAPGVEVFSPQVPDDDLLATVHDREYIAAVRAASLDPTAAD